MRALTPLRAWITGQRKDQSPGTRTEVPVIQLDRTFSTPDRPLVKFNPLSELDVEAGVGLHPRARRAVQRAARPRVRLDWLRTLHAPVHPGQHEREGRWWWEEATKKECGLHVGNVE